MLKAVLLILVVKYATGGNILIVQDVPTPSHSLWTAQLAMGLVRKGHNITRLVPGDIKDQKLSKNYHVIYFKVLGRESTDQLVDILGASPFKTMLLLYKYAIVTCKDIYQAKGLQQILEYPKSYKFDAIVIDLSISGCLLPLIKRFKFPPSVGVSPFMLPYYLALDFGNTIEHSYIPGFFIPLSDKMNLLERLTNYFWINLGLFLRNHFLKPKIQMMAINRFGESVGDLEEISKHVSLLLSNVDMALHYPQQLAPNIIPVGGLHMQREDQLPKDLQTIMDNAKEGVIIFSLGTVVKLGYLKLPITVAILQALGKLDQTIIMKAETNLTNVPPNIIVRQWIPQTELLAHPNTRLFISHGGCHSILEAAYYGVPVLGIPFFCDQSMNIVMMESKGIARRLDYSTITEDTIHASIRGMLNNTMYRKNMEKTSKRMRDQPQEPLERAVYWIEYSIRHNGTHFLNLRSRDLPLFITGGLDIHLFLLLLSCVITLFVTLACRHYSRYATSIPKIKKQ